MKKIINLKHSAEQEKHNRTNQTMFEMFKYLSSSDIRSSCVFSVYFTDRLVELGAAAQTVPNLQGNPVSAHVG